MKFINVSFSLAMILGLALILPSTLSAQQSGVGTEGGTQELVVGSVRCSGPIPDRPDDPVFGDLFIDIKGTTGIVQSIEFFSELAPDSPFEVCEAIIPEVAASARSLGCTAGRVTFDTDRFNNRRNGRFDFVCDGRRNQVMNAIAELAKQIVNVD